MGRIGDVTLTVCRVPNGSNWEAKVEVAKEWADWLHHSFYMGGPQHLRARDKIKLGAEVGTLAMSTQPYGVSPTLYSLGQY